MALSVRLALLLSALALAAPAAASAGTYDVVSCQSGGGLYANLAWTPANVPAGDGRYATDASCVNPGDPIGVALTAGNAFGAGTAAALRLQAPPGTTIADYQLRLAIRWNAVPAETTDAIVTLGDALVLGAGQWDPAVQNALHANGDLWLGWLGGFGGKQVTTVPETRLTLQRGNSPVALGVPAPSSMTLQAGCWGGAPGGCALDPGSQVGVSLTGSKVTISDPSAPALSVSAGQGLLAAGPRTGREAVSFAASDNTGIRRAELVDVTDPARPVVVGTQAGACDFRRALPCQDLPAGAVSPEPQLAGHRTLLLRVSDAAGNQVASAPFAVFARGPGNGLRAGDGARLSAGFRTTVVRRVKGKRRRVHVLRSSRTVGYGREATLRGTLRNAAGQAIAGAELQLLTRERRSGAGYVDAGTASTRRDGSYAAPLEAGASRTVLVAYKPFAGDDGPGPVRSASLAVRAGLRVTGPTRVKPRRAAVFRGRLAKRPVPARAVKAALQVLGRKGAWRTLRTTTAAANGRFALATRPGKRGRPAYRVRVRPRAAAYPYASATSRVMRLVVR